MAEPIRTMPLVCDKVSTHQGKDGTRWFAKQPRFVVHFPPVHGAWMKQVDQWCRIRQRQRLRLADCASQDHCRAKLAQCIAEWNQQAPPFN
jgi:hypothetical protein